MQVSRPRVAVVGHVEWVQFARVPHVPLAGEVVHAHGAFEEPAGGGGRRGSAAGPPGRRGDVRDRSGPGRAGGRSVARLKELGVDVQAARRAAAPAGR